MRTGSARRGSQVMAVVLAPLALTLLPIGCGNNSKADEGSSATSGGQSGGTGSSGATTGTSGGSEALGGSPSGTTGGLSILVPTGTETGTQLPTGVCDDTDFEVTGRTVDMLIVLDRSLSMDDSNLWIPMGSALTEVTAATQDSVNFGLMTFPFGNAECDPGGVLIEVGQQNASAIADVVGGGVSDVGTATGTPTAASLLAAKEYLDSLNDGLDKFVLLATDGAPNCNDSLDRTSCECSVGAMGPRPGPGTACQQNWWCLDDTESASAAAALQAAGYPVYVLGIGNSMQWESVMNAIAAAGGTNEYIPADSDEFTTVLLDIVGGIVSCDFDVDWSALDASANGDPNKVNLFCKQDGSEPNDTDLTTGNVVPKNDDCAKGSRGWTWTDETSSTIRLCADSCATLKNGGCPIVSATFGCKSVE